MNEIDATEEKERITKENLVDHILISLDTAYDTTVQIIMARSQNRSTTSERFFLQEVRRQMIRREDEVKRVLIDKVGEFVGKELEEFLARKESNSIQHPRSQSYF